MSIEKKLLLAFYIWSMMSIFTYGHAYVENIKEKDQFATLDAFLESILWPQHWSKVLWGKV